MAKGKTAKTDTPVETQAEYRQRVMDVVCSHMAEGQSLRRVCRSNKEIPAPSTICLWLNESTELAEQYTRARQLLADYRFDEYRDAASDIVEQRLLEGWEKRDAIAMARLETSNMQWEISKLAPKKYGDRTILAGDEESPLVSLTDEQLESRIAALANR
jgi:hypothetical protein